MSSPIPPTRSNNEVIDRLTGVLRMLNQAKRDGRSEAELDAWTQQNAGMSFKEFARKVGGKRRDPEAIAQMKDSDMVRMVAYGATLGWLDEMQAVVKSKAIRGTGFDKARKEAKAEIERIERDFPVVATAAKAFGLGALGVGGAIGAMAAAGGTAISGAAALSGVAAGGGVAGAGGLLGEESGAERMLPAMEGAAFGAGAGMVGPALRGGGAMLRGGLGLAQRGVAATKGASPVTKGVLAYEGIDKGSKLLKMLMGKASPGGLLDMLE